MHSPEHPRQLSHPLPNLLLDPRYLREDLLRRTMVDLLVHHFLVAVEGQVVTLRGDVGFRDGEALDGARTLALGGVALMPARERVGEIVLCVLLFCERRLRNGAEFLFGQERRAL